jgi:lipopolysaccharide export system ATP-binding protein
MLEIDHVSKKIDQRDILKKISFKIHQGEITALLGPNGSGKTTLFSILMGLMAPSSGSLLVDGEPLIHLTASQRILKGLCYLPQESSLFLNLSVLNNIECALELRGLLNKKKRRSRANELLSILRIEDLCTQQAFTLSAGQRRRVEFARLLACEPRFVLLDEPFAGVDPLSIEDIQQQIQLLQTHNIGILISDHNVQATLAIAQTAHVLIHGEIIASGTKEELYNHERVQKYYLGFAQKAFS